MNSLIRKISCSFISKVPVRTNFLFSKNLLYIEAPKHYSYYYPGEKKYDSEQSIEYDVSKDPEEWKFVERLLPSKWINDPVPKDSYPSGWKPPDPSALSLPYYVRRTKNHMLPIYLNTSKRGQRKLTIIRLIRGNIWLLHDELKKYIEDNSGKEIGIKVDELAGKLIIKGDHFYYANEWIKTKGF
ncbi:hypothetical protein O3M35_000796 [Rhynocoris fuscipes]|uniref:Large ribosomal subunit protein mL49 n=1 Tax=Rhynocoris fuscipes TaxID=488301 RepID=A0AAW1DNX8_9HEMI